MINQMLLKEKAFEGVLFYYSGVDEPGEGEHKLLDLIRERKINNTYC
jgi:5'-3' exonuclease